MFIENRRRAVADYSWLLGRGYANESALKLVGDRFQLRERQRKVVGRCACSDDAVQGRDARRSDLAGLEGRTLGIDGFNCLITIEAGLSRAPLFIARDSALRDAASVHGTYRKVEETEPALEALCTMLARARPAAIHWLFDRPVSNSGRLRGLAQACADRAGLRAEVALHDDVDRAVVRDVEVVASSDSWVIDHAASWVDLPAAWLATHAQAGDPWVLDLRTV